ncbi:Arginine biosynthesis bifunctional protein ArgJ OS=Lysinibacillus sphaericus OX=1421 GN=argJ PE=3 SV=1 [Lysinibacillus sphaericus]
MTLTASTNIMKKLSSKNIVSPKGFKAAGLVGLKHKKKDLAILVSDVPASVAGVFTTNAVQAAPLKVTKLFTQQKKCRQ